MSFDPMTPTMSVEEFLEKQDKDPNAWWRLSSGDHQNLFEMAVDQRDEARDEIAELKRRLARCEESY